MKTERLNGVVFILCSVTFVLQSVGYLSPAWFVREYRVKHGAEGFFMDGKRFTLIGNEPLDSADGTSDVMNAIPQGGKSGRRRRSILLTEEDKGNNDQSNLPSIMHWPPVQKPTQTVPKDDLPKEIPPLTHFEDMVGPDEGALPLVPAPKHTDSNDETEQSKGIPEVSHFGGLGGHAGDKTDKDQGTLDDSTLPTIDLPDGVKRDQYDGLTNDEIPQWPPWYDDAISDGLNGNPNTALNVPSIMDVLPDPGMVAMEKAMMMGNYIVHKRTLHVTAGLWYARACVNSLDPLSTSGDGVGTEWCTMYIRTNESTLADQMNVFEFRIEASAGLGICLLGLMVASSACCSQPRQGTRMIVTLLCMFISGAVMLVPVIHVIVQHQEMGGVFHRRRNWSRFMVHTYAQHDLFDHWSVVLCGCGSIISVLGSIIVTIMACGHQKPPGNRYDLSQSEKGDVKRELPVNWARNNKITVPPGKIDSSETPDSLGGDSDYHTETKDDCPSEGVPRDDSIALDDYDVETGNGNDVIDADNTRNDDLVDQDAIDLFEHVLNDE